MFQKFIGDKLQQQLEIQSTRAAEDTFRMSHGSPWENPAVTNYSCYRLLWQGVVLARK